MLVDSNVLTFTQSDPASATTGFAWSTSYNYKVRAMNAEGAGAYSTELTVATPTVPITMTSLSLVSKSVSSIVLSWTALTANSDTGRYPVSHYNLRVRLATSVSDLDWVYLTGSSGYLTTTFT
jgi:hypothetical protein